MASQKIVRLDVLRSYFLRALFLFVCQLSFCHKSHTLLTIRKHEIERVQIDDTVIVLDLPGVTDAPAETVENGHDDTTGEDDQPTEGQDVSDGDEDDAC